MPELTGSLALGAFLSSMLRVSTPVLLPSMGSLLAERAGVINVGLEGMMLTAAFAGVVTTGFGAPLWVGLVAAVAASSGLALLLAFVHCQLRADLIIAGLAINLLASGLTAALLFELTGDRGSTAGLPSLAVPTLELPLLGAVPFFGEFLYTVLGSQSLLTWVALLSPFLVGIVLYRSRFGVRVRAAGQNPEAAAVAGVAVRRIRYLALLWSGVFAGLGGAFLGMGYLTMFQRDFVAGRGFVALAAPILGRGRPLPTAAAALLFGAADAFSLRLLSSSVSSQLIHAFPYFVTLTALALFAGWAVWKRAAAFRRPS